MIRDVDVVAAEELRDVRDPRGELTGSADPLTTFREELGVEGRETSGVDQVELCEVHEAVVGESVPARDEPGGNGAWRAWYRIILVYAREG